MEARTLGDYNIIKQIGQGSLGAVYLAEHQYMKRQYVLKVLPEELSNDRGFIQRFEEDVAQLATLDHPNIVKIHNISFAGGHYFLVTDCIVDRHGESTTLAQYLQANPKKDDEDEVYRLLKQLAEALDYAHGKTKGIVHRGLKLNNILVGKGRTGTDLFICDFGLSRIIGPAAVLTKTLKAVAETAGMTTLFSKSGEKYSALPDAPKVSQVQNSFLQNYLFMSPEQKRIDHDHPVDLKADVYAFGVLAYYLLCGEFPEGIFEKPSQKLPHLKGDWDALIWNCMQSNPNKRPKELLPQLEKVFAPKESWPEAEKHIVNIEEIIKHEAPLMVHAATTAKAAHVHAEGPKPVLRDPKIERPVTDLDPAASIQVDKTVQQYIPERKEIKNTQPIFTEMAVIEGGSFSRGSNEGSRDELPRHHVILKNFAIDIHPVTNEQFVRFLEVMGGEKDSNHNDIIRMRDSRIKRSAGKLIIESGYTKHPVVGVTWYGAIAYAKWIGKRLPTEAEWEIAACGGIENALYPTGHEIEKSQANFFSADTTAVMSYAPNGYNLFDMAGNVYEWCQDWYGYNYYETSVVEPENPEGPLQGVYRVLRGGCWKSLKDDLRCSHRHRNNPGTVNGTYGFRCAADVE